MRSVSGSTHEHDPDPEDATEAAFDAPAAPARPAGAGHEAIAVDTTVREDRGRWVVESGVVFADEAVHRTVNDYPTRRHAEIAAQWIRRAADRDIQGPING